MCIIGLQKDAIIKMFETTNGDSLRESVASKLYRHEYALIGKDIFEDITCWLEVCGIKYKINKRLSNSIFIQIELI